MHTLYVDGAARGNPGPAGAGAVLYDADKKKVAEVAKFLGHGTNNHAEYKALIHGLEAAVDCGVEDITIKSDSQLVVRQILGQYKIKHPDLIPLSKEVFALKSKFNRFIIEHIPREQNSVADHLANQAIDLH